MREDRLTTQEDQERKDAEHRRRARERTRARRLTYLIDSILRTGATAKVYGRMADGSITVEHWAGGDQMPVSRWRIDLDGGIAEDNAWMD